MNYFWMLDEFVSVMYGRFYGFLLVGVIGIFIDSCLIGKGEVFFVIKGDWVDGYDYVFVVVVNGVVFLVVSEVKLLVFGCVMMLMIVVDDVLVGLECLGCVVWVCFVVKVIVVIGLVGKMMIKEMLCKVL